MKKAVSVMVGIIALICITALPVFASDQVKIILEGREIDTEPVQVRDGKVTAPVKDIAEALGADVKWERQSDSLVITLPDNSSDSQKGPDYSDIFRFGHKPTIGKTASPDNVLLSYYEALYFACNLPEDNKVPISGTIGSLQDPYPDAYACWSKEWRDKTSYEEFLGSWENTVNVELLKLIPAGEENGERKYFVETRNMEAIQDSRNPRMGVFCYKGYVTLRDTDEGWRITESDLEPEDPSWYMAGHQSWYADLEAVTQVIGMGVSIDEDLGPKTVEYNDDGSVTVKYQDKNGNDLYRILLIQTQDQQYQVISKEVVAR